MTHFSHQRGNRQGFTLLELLIVCLLISISLAFSIPNLRQSMVTDQLAAGSRKVVALVQSARSKAIREHVPYIIRHDPAERTLWYEQAETTDDETAEDTTLACPSITLPSGIIVQQIKQANATDEHSPEKDGLWISKQGYMDLTTIQLVDKKNNSINLLISPFIHRIQILEQLEDFN